MGAKCASVGINKLPVETLCFRHRRCDGTIAWGEAKRNPRNSPSHVAKLCRSAGARAEYANLVHLLSHSDDSQFRLDSIWIFESSARLILPRWLNGRASTIRNSRGTCHPSSPSRQWFSSISLFSLFDPTTYATRSSLRVADGIPKTIVSMTPGSLRRCSSTIEG